MKSLAACILLVLLAAPAALLAQGPTKATQPVSIENTPIAFPAASRNAESAAPGPESFQFARVLFALALVIALIFLLRWAGRRLFPGAVPQGPSRTVQVLGRTMLAPKQSIVLLRVGRRVLVVGDTGAQMQSLCEITDEQEIAELTAQLAQEKPAALSRTFGQLLGRARDERAAESPGAGTDEKLAAAQDELGGLSQRVRVLSKRFGAR